MPIALKRSWYRLRGLTPDSMEMVQYWKRSEKVAAKLMRAPNGATIMQMENEKYAFPGFPRGHLLFGKLSKLKHEIKNQIFNEAWYALEDGSLQESGVGQRTKEVLPGIFAILEAQKYDMVPASKMCEPVREIHRAWTKIAPSQNSRLLRDTLCHIIQEDDSYRFRVQWLTTYFNPNSWHMRFLGNPVQQLQKALTVLEYAEVVGDMKERIRLLRRIVMAVLEDSTWRDSFIALCREIDWKKVELSAADKFFFRGKYFKVDFDKFEY